MADSGMRYKYKGEVRIRETAVSGIRIGSVINGRIAEESRRS